jgi:predicted amidohydrolase YtcJ
MLLTNGRIYTMDARGSVADTLLVRDGRIAFVGRRGEVNVPARTRSIDLGGRAVLPGLEDGHGHLMHLARGALSLDLAGGQSEEHAAALVGAAAAGQPAGEWIVGRGWDQNRWPGARFPSRATLDRAAPRHPVALTRVDGHALWVNGPALQAAGIDRATPDPTGGIVVKDARGEPTGLLVDTAQRLVQDVVPPPPDDAFDRAVERAIARCLARGLTGIHEMGVDRRALDAYRRLVERGRFPFRDYAAVAARSPDTWARYREEGPETFGDGHVVVGALKLMADGALGSRGAALHSPYCDDPGNTGLLLYPPEELLRLTREALARRFQVCTHAIGDRANTLVLDAYERALRTVAWP